MPIELLDGRKIIQELEKELGLMGKLAKRQGSTFHRELDDTHGLSSQQIWARPLPQEPGIQAGTMPLQTSPV